MPCIAIAGFQHETNTFGRTKAGMSEFEMADSWPGLLRGRDVCEGTRGINLPIAGFWQAAEAAGVDLLPILWCAAEPSAHVTADAFQRISGEILRGLQEAGPLDGIYLDLHGAMVTELSDDGEGALLELIRAEVGPDMPIAVSLDLHANVTARMVRHASVITIFRTYPHLDMAATGARCLPLLQKLIAGARPAMAFRQVPFLIPLPAQFTGAEPCAGLYRAVERAETDDAHAELALGFTAADIADCGPSILAYAPTQAEAEEVADRLFAQVLAAEPELDGTLLTPSESVRQAMANTDARPVVIADVQDNAGAGATSDTTGMLKALIEAGATGAILGLMADPDLAALAHRAGVSAELEGPMGGRSGWPGDTPHAGRFRVEAIGDGRCAYTGEMYGGATAELGPTAVLRVLGEEADIRVVVTSQRSQCLDLALFRHIGVEPTEARVIVVKSTVHFRADFDPIAADTLSAAAPGAFPCDLASIDYRHLRPGVRRGR